MIDIETAVKRAIESNADLYNRKSNCPDDQRDAELRNIYRLAEMAPDGAACEIGVKHGGSLACWACAREGRGELIAVDTKFRPSFYDTLDRYDLHPELYANGSDAAALEVSEPLAFLFVDGDHGAQIWNDIENWTPKMMIGGIIAFHDFGVYKITVQVATAVTVWQRDQGEHWRKLGQVGSTIAFVRLS